MSEKNVPNEQELWNVLDDSAEPVKEAAPVKAGRKLDGFFFACMAGVAAVSVAATLVIGGMLGGEKVYGGANVPDGEGINAVLEQQAEELKLENAELRAQLELQKEQIKTLQAELLDLSGGDAELPTMSTDPNEQDELMAQQLEAYDIFHQIKAAYADFDREKLEELIPEMDKRISFLGTDAMNEYYLILEYVEMPSNG
ncbi:MAG: hypothetical protein IJY40_08340 [Oscillospiraceae bacterium]|nr:hypothetical protein [Oscillospiraceae bacterium]